MTSAAAATEAGAAHKTALGYAENSAIGYATFSGQPANASTVLIRYTYYGDANLDTTVNTVDFNLLASNFSLTLPGDLPGGGLGALVPEPVLAPMALAETLLLRRRRCSLLRPG